MPTKEDELLIPGVNAPKSKSTQVTEDLNQTIRDSGLLDTSTEEEATTAVNEQEIVTEPTPTPAEEPKMMTLEEDAVKREELNKLIRDSGLLDTTPTPAPTPTPEEKVEPSPKEEELKIPGVNAPKADSQLIKEELNQLIRESGLLEPKEKSEPEIISEQKGFSFTKDTDGTITHTPKTLDEAISLYEQFGADVKIDPNSMEAITGSKIYGKYSKYKNAPESVYLEGFKTNEIGVGGETWDRLVKMNGGEPTAAMLAAQRQYDNSLKLGNVLGTTGIISGTPTETQTETNTTTLQDLDKSFVTAMSGLFGDIATEWEEHKAGTEKMSNLNKSMTDTVAKIDELNVEKREIMDDIREQYPNLPLSQQLVLADERLDAVDDQLFVLQRQYNSDLSTYKFESEKAKGEFEFTQKNIQTKMDLLSDMYGIQRGDIIREGEVARADRIRLEDIERQDDLLADQLERADFEYQRALSDGDKARAKEIGYQKDLLRFQKELNKSAKDNIINLGGESYLENVNGRWELKSGAAGDIPASTVTPSGRITQMDYTLPTGTRKTLQLDEAAIGSLENIIPDLEMEGIIIGDSLRTPEEQKALHDAFLAGTGGQAAAPGESKHETGLAIDAYNEDANGNLVALTTDQVRMMNEAGWYQTAGEEDMGHFEYRGVPGAAGELTTSQLLAAKQLAGQMPGSKKADAVAQRQADIESLMRQGQTIDEIQDALRLGEFGLEFTGTVKSAFDTITSKLSPTLTSKAQNILEDKVAEFGVESNEVKDYLKKVASESLGVDGAKEIRGNELLINALNDIKTDLKTLEDEGVDTGILAGTEEEIAKKIKGVANEDMRKLATKIQKTIQTYRRAVSGAAFTESESEEYKDIFPSIGRTAKYNTAAIEGLMESTQLSLDGTYSFIMGENEYNELFKGVAPVEKDEVDTYVETLEADTNADADSYVDSLDINP